MPVDLAGATGRNRATGGLPQISAQNDLEAIACWLAEFVDTPTTFRNYRKEADRLVLWATQERGLAISGLTREDLRADQARSLRIRFREKSGVAVAAPRTNADWDP